MKKQMHSEKIELNRLKSINYLKNKNHKEELIQIEVENKKNQLRLSSTIRHND